MRLCSQPLAINHNPSIRTAKGGPGKQAQKFVKRQPPASLELRHSHDGTKNKSYPNRMH